MSAGKVSAQPVQEGGFVNPTYNMQLFRPAIDTKGYVTLNASQVLGHKEFSLGLVGTWAGKPLALEILGGSTQPLSGMVVTNGRKFTVSHLITAQLQFAIGLFKHAELGLTVPLSIMQGSREVCEPNKDCGGFLGSTDSRDDLSFSKVGFADPGIHVKGRFLNTSKYPVGLGGMLSTSGRAAMGTSTSCQRAT
jgi:hypothetical protein